MKQWNNLASMASANKIKITISKVFEKTPIYAPKRGYQALLENSANVCLNCVATYRKKLGLKVIFAVKQVEMTGDHKQHKKYSTRSGGLIYLIQSKFAVHTEPITKWTVDGLFCWRYWLTLESSPMHKISNLMDCALVIKPLDEHWVVMAKLRYSTPLSKVNIPEHR